MPRRDQPQPRPAALTGSPMNLRLSTAQRDALGFLADAEGVAVSAIARRAIDAYLSGFVDVDQRTLLEVADLGELDAWDPTEVHVVPDLGE